MTGVGLEPTSPSDWYLKPAPYTTRPSCLYVLWSIAWKMVVDTMWKFSKRENNTLFRSLILCLRCIKFEPFSAASSPIFKSLKVLKIEDILHLNILTFVYKSINKLSPPYFYGYFQPNSAIHKIATRQATRGDLFKSFRNTTLYGLQTIQYYGSKLWNTLPLFIRVASSPTTFRSKLKTHFIDAYV